MTPELFKKLSGHDLALYYNGTFVRAKYDNGPMQWRICRQIVGESFASCSIEFRGDSAGSSIAVPLKMVEFDFTIPESGVYNFKNMVIFFARRPIRSSAKSINNQNCYFSNILQPVMNHGGIPKEFYQANDFVLNCENLNLLFDARTPPDFGVGLSKIAKKQALAYALNSRISLSQGIYSTNPSIWLKKRIIGELDLDRRIAIPLDTSFVPELANLFDGTGIKTRYS